MIDIKKLEKYLNGFKFRKNTATRRLELISYLHKYLNSNNISSYRIICDETNNPSNIIEEKTKFYYFDRIICDIQYYGIDNKYRNITMALLNTIELRKNKLERILNENENYTKRI